MTLLVTGGAGFIGSAVVRRAIADGRKVVTVDALTYAGNLANLVSVQQHPNHVFEHVDICNKDDLVSVFDKHAPKSVVHLAAESHVDRSIDGPGSFVETNIVGSFNLLQAALECWDKKGRPEDFRFVHVSTDEVYGSLGSNGFFDEDSPYAPNSPYAASKASSDHLARAWFETYKLPVVITNCSNNYGPYQYPEKLIPVVILNAISGQPIPVYGSGDNVRDWLHVNDHADALLTVLDRATPGERFNIGTRNECSNMALVKNICSILDDVRPMADPYEHLITHVTDRPGHDARYAIDPAHFEETLGWSSSISFEDGLRETVRWYLNNTAWVEGIDKTPAHDVRRGLNVHSIP